MTRAVSILCSAALVAWFVACSSEEPAPPPTEEPECAEPCPEGGACVQGECVCATESTVCDDACVNLSSDENHCGSCGSVCDGSCTEGRCRSVLATGYWGLAIAVDSDAVYFADRGEDIEVTISRLPLDGDAATVLATNQDEPSFLAVDSASVYWTSGWDIFRAPGGDGTPMLLATDSNGMRGLAVNGTSVYWTRSNPEGGIVGKVPYTGGEPETIYTGRHPGPRDLAVDDEWVYFTFDADSFETDGAVMKVPEDGGEAVTLVSNLGEIGGLIALDDDNVYFSTYTFDDGGALNRVSKSGGEAEVLATHELEPHDLTVNGGYLYWLTCGSGGDEGLVMKVGLADGSSTTLASGERCPAALAVDDSSVYWADSNTGEIVRLSPK